MKNLVGAILFILLMSSFHIRAQTDAPDSEAIKQVVIDLFDGMREQDTSKLVSCFAGNARLLSSGQNKEGKPAMRSMAISDWTNSIANAKGRYLDEQITSWHILQDGNLASVWTDYLLYVDGNFIHCGIDAFQMVKLEDGWKITQLTDTRRKEDCIQTPEDHLQVFLNRWHNGASTADEELFFGSMTEDCIYIGTDASERWLRDELKEWSKTYFERESAWDFKTKSRNIQISEDGRMAWFDELLDTWMGDCRGSGICVLTSEGWKIKHYHLSIAVPNEVIEDYMELLKNDED